MNGRVYDPQLGRFLSADPIVQTINVSQAINPFSYVMNNPLTLTDLSGHSWLSRAFHAIGSFIKQWGGLIVTIVLWYYGVPIGWAGAGGAAFSYAVNGGSFGAFALSFAVGFIAGAIAGPIAENVANFLKVPAQNLLGVMMRGAIAGALSGGISSKVMGGSFGVGALGGAIAGAIAAGAMFEAAKSLQSRGFDLASSGRSSKAGGPYTTDAPADVDKLRADSNSGLADAESYAADYSDRTGNEIAIAYYRNTDGTNLSPDGVHSYSFYYGANGTEIDLPALDRNDLLILEHTHPIPVALGPFGRFFGGSGLGPSFQDSITANYYSNSYSIIRRTLSSTQHDYIYYGASSGYPWSPLN